MAVSDHDGISTGITTGHALQDAKPVHRHRLTDPAGIVDIELLSLGATLDRVLLHENGSTIPLVLSLPDLEAREDPNRNPYFGVTVGRYANRLRNAQVTLDGITHALDANEGDHQLHGGNIGFSRFVWDVADSSGNSITLERTSPAGEMGFPGTVEVSVTYEVSDGTIRITHKATTDAPTVVSMTNHAYWNLGGPTEDDIGDHEATIAAHTVVPIDDDTLPSGAPEPIEGTPFDLREPTRLRDRLGFSMPNGFDHCFMVEGDGLRRHATVTHPDTGRRLEVWSDQPAVQFYTGAFLGGGDGADGRTHDPFAAFCLEPQHVPDAPNLEWAPSPVLLPGERYVHHMEYRLSAG